MLSNNLLMFRINKGVTQEELAKAIGITRQTVIAIEKGNYTPSVLLAIKISRYFNVRVEELFMLINER